MDKRVYIVYSESYGSAPMLISVYSTRERAVEAVNRLQKGKDDVEFYYVEERLED